MWLLSRILNLGIVAHVDAGKTTLTERLLFESGTIGAVGRVDDGTTLTDSLDLERRRGITIRSAVASLVIDDVSVNIIDTPGHPDFIAEVDRVLGVLDGAVLVVSAVEGVQPQTRVLMRALQRLRVPTLIFINKIDRRGSDVDGVLHDIERRLAVRAVPLIQATNAGTRAAATVTPEPDRFHTALVDALIDDDDALFEAYVADPARVTPARLRGSGGADVECTRVPGLRGFRDDRCRDDRFDERTGQPAASSRARRPRTMRRPHLQDRARRLRREDRVCADVFGCPARARSRAR